MLFEAKLFSTLNCKSGYFQILINEQDRDETAFVSHHGLYRLSRISFELTNSPDMFQRAIDTVLSSFRWKFSFVYLDDIIVFSKNIEEHMARLIAVLTVLRDLGLTRNLRRFFFLETSVECLGHISSQDVFNSLRGPLSS